jgi:hypothetical protein
VKEVIIGLVLAAIAISVIPRRPLRRKILLFLVGASAGLERAQIHKVHLVVFVVLLLVTVGRSEHGFRINRHGLIIPLATALLCSSVELGTLVNSHSFSLQLLLLSVTAFALVATLQPGESKFVLGGLLTLVSASSFYALLQFVHVVHLVLFQGTSRPRGFYSEPDWLGLFSGIGILLSIRAPLRTWQRLVLVLVNAGACGLAQARSSWLAVLVVALVLGLAMFFKRDVPDRRAGNLRLLMAFLIVGAMVLALDSNARSVIATRFEAISPNSTAGLQPGFSNYSSSKVRANELQTMFDLVETAPWHGWGLSAEGRVQPTGIIQYVGVAKNNVASDWLLGLLLDGALLSLPLVILLLYAAIRRLPRTQCLLLLLVLVNSLLSNAIAFPITWVALALVMTMLREMRTAAPLPQVPRLAIARKSP